MQISTRNEKIEPSVYTTEPHFATYFSCSSNFSFMSYLMPQTMHSSGLQAEGGIILVPKGKQLAFQDYFSLKNLLRVLKRTSFFLFDFYFSFSMLVLKKTVFLSFSDSLEKGWGVLWCICHLFVRWWWCWLNQL